MSSSHEQRRPKINPIERIEAAERELAAAKAELATPEYDPDALYVIQREDTPDKFTLVRGLYAYNSVAFGPSVKAPGGYTVVRAGKASPHPHTAGLWPLEFVTITKVEV